jgi:hypothetical protein
VTRVKNFIFTALAYLLLTFPCAYLWHLVFFRSFYERIGYFGEKEPIVALGFLTIAAQGFVLAYAYPFFQRGRNALVDGMRAAAIFGLLIGSVQVVAAAAKNHAPATAEWFLFESLYFVIQFTLIGLALAFIHRPTKGTAIGA